MYLWVDTTRIGLNCKTVGMEELHGVVGETPPSPKTHIPILGSEFLLDALLLSLITPKKASNNVFNHFGYGHL